MNRDKAMLRRLQALPLDAKILMTKQRIREWYNYFHGKVCISFSGGKDSTVLAHLVHEMYPEVPMVFANTGLEYPEIQAFARKMGAEFVRPKLRFDEVISKYGYPLISKEVAEAIHYARRIVRKEVPEEPLENIGGGVAFWRRQNLSGTMPGPGEIQRKEPEAGNLNGGGNTHQTQTARHAGNPDDGTIQNPRRTDSNCTDSDRYPDYRTEQSNRTTHRMEFNGTYPEQYSGSVRKAVYEQARRMYEKSNGGGRQNITETNSTGRETTRRRGNLVGGVVLQTDAPENPESAESVAGSEGLTEHGNSSQAGTDWHDLRRKAIAGNAEEFQGNSQFNKKKWLPLCQETEFYISHYCCAVMKKGPMSSYQHKTKRVPFLGTMADESRMRAQAWVRHGCNAFECKKQISMPLSFWTEQDVLQYIKLYGIEIASVYGEILAVDDRGMLYDPIPGVPCKLKCSGCQRTGCMFCAFGAYLEKTGESRFQRLARTHPRQYEYCMGGGQYVDNPNYDPAAPAWDGDWKNWNPKKVWVPSKEGLGMRKVFEDCNKIYGKDFVRYE